MNIEELYRTYFDIVYRYIRSISQDGSLAEEVTQETFFKALEKIDQFRGDCDVRVWLCQIAKNTLYDHLKKQKKQLLGDEKLEKTESAGGELLEEKLFTSLLEYARGEFDYIMIDTPPMASLIDGAIVARQCDGAVMVVESGCISYRLEQRVKSQLDKSGCRILGVVLNKVSMERNGYYSKYYGRYGKYGKYSKYGHYGKYDRYEKAEV